MRSHERLRRMRDYGTTASGTKRPLRCVVTIMPEKEWPTRTVGPFCRSSTCCAEATASGTPFPELHLPPCASGDERGRCAGKRSTRKSASVHHHDSLPSSQGLEL